MDAHAQEYKEREDRERLTRREYTHTIDEKDIVRSTIAVGTFLHVLACTVHRKVFFN